MIVIDIGKSPEPPADSTEQLLSHSNPRNSLTPYMTSIDPTQTTKTRSFLLAAVRPVSTHARPLRHNVIDSVIMEPVWPCSKIPPATGNRLSTRHKNCTRLAGRQLLPTDYSLHF